MGLTQLNGVDNGPYRPDEDGVGELGGNGHGDGGWSGVCLVRLLVGMEVCMCSMGVL